MAKYELCPLGCRICPSTKLVVGLMNSQCYRDNPFSSNLSLRSLGGPKKNETDCIILFYRMVFSSRSASFFFGFFLAVGGPLCTSHIQISLSIAS